MQINLSSFIESSITTEQRIGAELLKSLGLNGFAADGMSLMDIFGAPGNSAMGSSAGRDIEQIRGWNHTAILAKSLQFGIGNLGVFCPLWTAHAIADHYGEEYSAATRFTGTEQYGVPEDWVEAPRQHRISKLLRRPNPWCDTAQFLFQMEQQVEAHGVCHILVLPTQDEQLPAQLWIIPKANIYPCAPSSKFPEGSYRVGHLSRVSIGSRTDRQPQSLPESLAWLSDREYSAKWVISIGLPSIVYLDDFLNPSSAISDALDTDTQIHQSRRNTLNKQMTNGPRLEELPGVNLQSGERDKLLEEFEYQNQGVENSGRAWISPKGIKVVNDAHSAREMEFTNSANQSRDHILGQRLWPAAMLGLGDGGSYSQIVGIIKGTSRLILQPLMRIFSGQLSIGLQRFFEAPQDDFMALIQAASIDDPEQKAREWGIQMQGTSVTVGELRKGFNLQPLGDERDKAIAGTLGPKPPEAGGAGGGMPGLPGLPAPAPAGAQQPAKQPEVGINGGDVGPDKPGGQSPLPEENKETDKAVQNVFGGLTRQQFVRNRKAVMDTLQQLENKSIREKTAIATLKTLGLSAEQAQEFVDSVKDEEQAIMPTEATATPTEQIPEVATALFARAVESKKNVILQKPITESVSTTQNSSQFAKSANYDDRIAALHYRRGEDAYGIPHHDIGQNAERANLIADILVGVFGDDAERMLSDGNDFATITKIVAKLWDESKYNRHPGGSRMGGRFAPKNSMEALSAAHGAIEVALTGARTEESASELVDLLSNLTLNELRDIKIKYKMSASGRLKRDLVSKIAARLDSGRRVEPEVPVTQPTLEPKVELTIAPAQDESFEIIAARRMQSGRTDFELRDAFRNYQRGTISQQEFQANLNEFDAEERRRNERAQDPIEQEVVADEVARDAARERRETPRLTGQPALDRIAILGQNLPEGFMMVRNRTSNERWLELPDGTRAALGEPAPDRLQAIEYLLRQRGHDPDEIIGFARADNQQPRLPVDDEVRLTSFQHAPSHGFVISNPDQNGIYELRAPDGRAVILPRTNAERLEVIESEIASLVQRTSQAAAPAPEPAAPQPPDSQRAMGRFSPSGEWGITARRRIIALMDNIPPGLTVREPVSGTSPPSDRLEVIERQLHEAGWDHRTIGRNSDASQMQYEDISRLENLQRAMPTNFNVTAPNSNGLRTLREPNGQTSILPRQSGARLAFLDSVLRANGINSQEFVDSRRNDERNVRITPLPAPAAPVATISGAPQTKAEKLASIGADFLDNMTPDANGNLIQPRMSKAKVKVNYREFNPPATWSSVPVDQRREIEDHWMAAQRVSLKGDTELQESWRDEAEEVATSVADSLRREDIAFQIHPKLTQIAGLENATFEDTKTLLETGENTAVKLAEQYRQEVKAREIRAMLNGGSTWLKTRYENEIATRKADITETDWHSYAKDGGFLDARTGDTALDERLKTFKLKVQDLPSLVGALDGWTVDVAYAGYKNGISVEASNNGTTMSRTIYMDDQGKLIVKNNSFFANADAPKGMGLEIFSNAVAYAKSKGVYKFSTNPCRSDRREEVNGVSVNKGMVGYAVWPQFGYDAPLSEISGPAEARARQAYPQARTVRDIFDTPGGQKWWWEHGSSINTAEFYMADDSRNIKALQSYMASKKADRERVRSSAT